MTFFRPSENIYCHVDPRLACNYHRVVLPMKYMGSVASKVPLIFFNRTSNLELDAIDHMKSLGFKVVLDLDDDIALDPDHVLYDAYRDNKVTQKLVAHLRRADVVMVTNAVLAGRIKDYHRQIVVVPNALPFDQDQFHRSALREGRKIVYVGGFTHLQDLEVVYDSVPRKQLLIAGLLEGGNDLPSRAWSVIRKRFHFAEFRPAKELPEYMSLYDGPEIAIAPLADTPFNRCKSNLKMLEAGAKGLAFVASGLHPYLNEIDSRATLYASSRSEWKQQLMKLLGDAAFRREQSERLAAHVREHYHLDRVNQLRKQVFESFS
jgi:hypothetical protein